jgi:hypothetical protein
MVWVIAFSSPDSLEISRKQGFKGLNFEKINEDVFHQYVIAVQMVADRNYEPMEKIIELIF